MFFKQIIIVLEVYLLLKLLYHFASLFVIIWFELDCESLRRFGRYLLPMREAAGIQLIINGSF